MQSKQQCWLSVRSLYLSLLSLNPGLTHAILISLLRDNHDPEREKEGAQIHIAFSFHNDFFSNLLLVLLFFETNLFSF